MVAGARTGKGPWTYEELSRRTPEDHVRSVASGAPDLVPAGAVIVSTALDGFEPAVDDLLPLLTS